MKINEVHVSYETFKLLYQIYNEYVQKKQSVVFDNDISDVMDTLAVSINISGISSFDLLVLFDMTSHVYYNDEHTRYLIPSDKTLAKKSRPEFIAAIQLANKIHHEFNEKDYPCECLPLANGQYDVIVSFIGSELFEMSQLTGNAFTDYLFRDGNGFFKSCPDEEYFKNYFSGKFTQAFFTHVLNLTTKIDVKKEYYMQKFYSYAESDPCGKVSLYNVTSGYGELTFCGSSAENLNEKISEIKGNPFFSRTTLMDTMKYTFLCTTTMMDFIYLRHLGFGKIFHHENYKVVYAKNSVNIPDDISEKFGDELREVFSDFNKVRKEIDNAPTADLSQLQYIYHGSVIHFMYQISHEDLLKWRTLLNQRVEGRTYPEFLPDVFSQMYQTSEIILSALMP